MHIINKNNRSKFKMHFGEDTDDILKNILSYSDEKVAELHEDGIV